MYTAVGRLVSECECTKIFFACVLEVDVDATSIITLVALDVSRRLRKSKHNQDGPDDPSDGGELPLGREIAGVGCVSAEGAGPRG